MSAGKWFKAKLNRVYCIFFLVHITILNKHCMSKAKGRIKTFRVLSLNKFPLTHWVFCFVSGNEILTFLRNKTRAVTLFRKFTVHSHAEKINITEIEGLVMWFGRWQLIPEQNTKVSKVPLGYLHTLLRLQMLYLSKHLFMISSLCQSQTFVWWCYCAQS